MIGYIVLTTAYDYNDEYHSPRDTERLHSYVVYKDEKAVKRVLGQKTREQVRAVLDNPGTWKDSGSFEYATAYTGSEDDYAKIGELLFPGRGVASRDDLCRELDAAENASHNLKNKELQFIADTLGGVFNIYRIVEVRIR